MYTDASNEGVGVTLGQIQNGREVAIAYAGRFSICFLFGNHSGPLNNPQFHCKFQSFFLFPIIYTAFSFYVDCLSSLSMDSHQSRPILQLAESSHKTHIVRVPAYAFSRLVSPSLLSFCSPFYEAFLNRHDTNFTTSSCSHCGSEHSVQQFCLPSDYSPAEVNFLLDFLERTPQATFAPDLFLSVIRLCDYLLIPHHVIFDLIQLYIPRHLRVRSRFTTDLVQTLNSTSYAVFGHEFAHTYFALFCILGYYIFLFYSKTIRRGEVRCS